MTNPRKKEFKHDFLGSWVSPLETSIPSNTLTFSVGIFQWIPKASGKGLKKSKVKYRVKGYTSNPEPVYRRAGEVCKLFDNRSKWTGKKSEMMK